MDKSDAPKRDNVSEREKISEKDMIQEKGTHARLNIKNLLTNSCRRQKRQFVDYTRRIPTPTSPIPNHRKIRLANDVFSIPFMI